MQRQPTTVKATPVHGIDVDPQTRCAHYDGPTDIIALRFHCCDRWYPCFECHQECEAHEAIPWPLGVICQEVVQG